MMIVATGSAAYAGHDEAIAAHTVRVCSDYAPAKARSLVSSYILAANMFERIGVKLEWRMRDCPAGALQIRLSTNTETGLKPGALAYASPYDGTHIVVFLDRITRFEDDGLVTAVLAHVFAHEITHILQATNRHALSGLMKAHWNRDDFLRMASQPLSFTPDDIDLIYIGLERRESLLLTAVGTR